MEKELNIREDLTLTIEKAGKGLEYGEVEVIVSNSGLDRHGEQIMVNGIDTSQIMKNPVLLWGHDYSSLPIGQIKKVWKSSGNLMARIKLDYDLYDFANTVYQMILRGTINAVSVGGLVRQWNDDYTIVEKLEMLELSVVPIGAHPDALVTRKELKKEYENFVFKSLAQKYKESDKDETIQVLQNIINALQESKKTKGVKKKIVLNY